VAPGENKKKYEKMFILGPNWVVYSTPHDATSFVIFFNFEFIMLYECDVTRKNVSEARRSKHFLLKTASLAFRTFWICVTFTNDGRFGCPFFVKFRSKVRSSSCEDELVTLNIPVYTFY